MDTEVWRVLTAAVRSADRRVARRGRKTCYTDQQIVRMYLWSVAHDRPLCWACDRRHYNGVYRPPQLPSVSQFCRRVKTTRVQELLQAVNAYLTRAKQPARLSFLDGKPLPIGICSRDPDARVGYATKGFANGYKLHALATDDGRILRFAVRPMNEGEARIARDFADSVESRLVLADANYDTKHLYQAFGAHGAQLLTPLKRVAQTAPPLRRMGPERRFAIRLYQRLGKDYYKLLTPRSQIERIFSALCCFGGGLASLPPWVRRLDRVTRWVTAKIAIYHARLRRRKRAA